MAAPVEACSFPVFKTNMLHVSDMAELLLGPPLFGTSTLFLSMACIYSLDRDQIYCGTMTVEPFRYCNHICNLLEYLISYDSGKLSAA
jgi:hypothetical protein